MPAPRIRHAQWDGHAAIQNWFSKNLLTSSTPQTHKTVHIHFYDEGEPIPIRELETAVIRAASLVDQFGVEYLPIFERLERELEKAKRDLDTMERVRRIAASIDRSPLDRNLIKP